MTGEANGLRGASADVNERHGVETEYIHFPPICFVEVKTGVKSFEMKIRSHGNAGLGRLGCG